MGARASTAVTIRVYRTKKEEQPVKLFLFTSLTRVELAHLPPEGSALSTELQRQVV